MVQFPFMFKIRRQSHCLSVQAKTPIKNSSFIELKFSPLGKITLNSKEVGVNHNLNGKSLQAWRQIAKISRCVCSLWFTMKKYDSSTLFKWYIFKFCLCVICSRLIFKTPQASMLWNIISSPPGVSKQLKTSWNAIKKIICLPKRLALRHFVSRASMKSSLLRKAAQNCHLKRNPPDIGSINLRALDVGLSCVVVSLAGLFMLIRLQSSLRYSRRFLGR